VPDGYFPTLFDHIGDMFAGFMGGDVLVFNGDVFIIFDQRISANCDHSQFSFGHSPTGSLFVRHLIGRVYSKFNGGTIKIFGTAWSDIRRGFACYRLMIEPDGASSVSGKGDARITQFGGKYRDCQTLLIVVY
jgi:hypothetical protein